MNGYIRLYRKIVDWEWYTDTKTKALFIHLLLLANHDDKKWRGEIIKRGELVTSRSSLSSQTGLSEQQIRTSLRKLRSTNDITIKTTNKNTLIMVVKYDFYQSDEQTKMERATNGLTNNQPSSNHQITTNKNDKNNKKEKNNIYSRVPDDVDLSIAENEEIPYEEIVGYLNNLANTNYRYQTIATKDKIKARWDEGFRLSDFKTVIKNKCDDWLNTELEKYLRPETLFGNKFESYLNQKQKRDVEDVPEWYEDTKQTKPSDELLKSIRDIQRKLWIEEENQNVD